MRGESAGGEVEVPARISELGPAPRALRPRSKGSMPRAKITTINVSTFLIAHPIITKSMPELPDVSVYVEALQQRLLGQPLVKLRLTSPFVLRTFDPPPSSLEGKHVLGIRRLGKRIVFELAGELYLIVHLMIAGRFRWLPGGGRGAGA